MSYVVVDNLTKKYNQAEVLKNLSLSINKGELVTLLGPSGCGKSTLLQCIAGLTDHQEGKIVLDKKEITNVIPKNREVGFMFQSYALFPNMNVFNNIAFGLIMRKLDKKTINTKVNEVLELVELKDRSEAYPNELSGGQQQRVALARSLVIQPKLMLMDEPFSALDAKIRKNLRSELRKIQKDVGMTTIFVTHDQEEALTISDRVFVMQEGEIVQIGTPQEIYERPKTEFVAGFIGNFNILPTEKVKNLGLNVNKYKKIAIRPEAICLYPKASTTSHSEEEGIWLEGSISDKTLLGNVLRYKVSTDRYMLYVDTINAPFFSQYNEAEEVKMFIPKNSICFLN